MHTLKVTNINAMQSLLQVEAGRKEYAELPVLNLLQSQAENDWIRENPKLALFCTGRKDQ
jgi:hypothetical protein